MLKRWLDRLQPTDSGDEAPHDVALATAVLLHEVAVADAARDPLESQQVLAEIRRAFALNDDEAADLQRQSALEADRTVSLHALIDALNQSLDGDAKRALCARLWRVAYADGTLDPQEEALIRRLADLLFIPHAVFVQEKLKIQPDGGAEASAGTR